MAAVTVSRANERLIAVKHVGAERSSEIAQEAELLKQLDHPRIVRFVDIVETPDGGRALHTLFVSSDTWATRPLTDPAERAAGMAALAGVIADLHDLGVTHRNLTASHVIHGDGDRPVLCSLSHAGDASAANVQIDLSALADLNHDDHLARGPLTGKLMSLAKGARSGQFSARDLARQLDGLLARQNKRRSPTQPGRWRERVAKVPRKTAAVVGLGVAGIAVGLVWVTGRQGDLAAVAVPDPVTSAQGPDSAVQDDFFAASAAPYPGDLSAPQDLSVVVDGNTTQLGNNTGNNMQRSDSAIGGAQDLLATSPGTFETDPKDKGVNPGGAASTRNESANPRAEDVNPGYGGADPEHGSADPGYGSADQGYEGANPRHGSANPGYGGADPRHGGAEAGVIVEHRGRRYSIGTAGDIVVIGDWDCDSEATPALIRPHTGAVVLFDAWPEPNATITMSPRWQVESVVSVQVERFDSCDQLRIHSETGSQLLDPRRAS